MTRTDVEKLLQPVSPVAPCGDDPEQDPELAELERASKGKPQREMGDAVIPAEPPNWRDVADRATRLLARAKDLRVAVTLTRALVHTGGLPGLADGLAVVAGLLEHYWDELHPRLDPEDHYDPTLRLNTLAALADAEANLRAARDAPVVESRAAGRFSLRDVLMATGALAPPAQGNPPDLAAIEAAFAECDLGELEGTARAADEALAQARRIDALVSERVGSDESAPLSELAKLLASARQVLTDRLAWRRPPPASGEADAPSPPGRPPSTTAPAAPRAPGEIANRDDVVRTLDRLCEYFERAEPSSPVPILLRRARRLVSKSFLDVIRDLAPDAVAQVEALRGVDTEGE